jgi:hypothetical protein
VYRSSRALIANNAEVVKDKGEGDGAAFVAPQSRGQVGRFVAILGSSEKESTCIPYVITCA